MHLSTVSWARHRRSCRPVVAWNHGTSGIDLRAVVPIAAPTHASLAHDALPGGALGQDRRP